jgi:ABC-2 type transport system ATP-binding protein
MENLLEIRQLTKSYGDFSLQEVDLDVPIGTITGLVGANGAGKSTLLKLVLGLLPPDEGEIKLFGQDALCDSGTLRKRIGFVQESPTLYSHLRIEEMGRLVAPFYPAWNEAVFKRLCSLFELPLKTPFKKMSQGTRMKTALVLALSHDADLLLLDEPTSGLDPLVRREVLDLLLEAIEDKNKAVLFSTHITSDLDRVADHVAILKKGQMVLTGAKEELLESWILVKGGEELFSGSLKDCCYGEERSGPGLTLLCKKDGSLERMLPSNALLERPNLEDLVYFYGRKLEVLCTH